MGHYEVQLAPVKSSKKLIFLENFCFAGLFWIKTKGMATRPCPLENKISDYRLSDAHA